MNIYICKDILKSIKSRLIYESELIDWVNEMDNEDPEKYIESFYRFIDYEIIFSPLEVFVMPIKFAKYLARCILKSLPIVVYSKEHLGIAHEMIKYHYYGVEPPMEIVKQENVIICCKHYPFTCDEVRYNPKISAIYGNHLSFFDGRSCSCPGNCNCQKDTPSNVHYWNLQDEDDDELFMEHFENCYEDCCTHSKVYERYVIKLI